MERGQIDWAQEIEFRRKYKNNYSEKEIFKILKQLTSGLSYLQNKKIAHRDIKPHNILVFPNNVYKIADLGEAETKIKNKTQKGIVIGSELFMSPLLYYGLTSPQNYNYIYNHPFKSDVFSLGYCIIYAMSLNENFLHNIRESDNQFYYERRIKQYFEKDYPTIKDIAINMVKYKEEDRFDFQQLEKELNKINIKNLK